MGKQIQLRKSFTQPSILGRFFEIQSVVPNLWSILSILYLTSLTRKYIHLLISSLGRKRSSGLKWTNKFVLKMVGDLQFCVDSSKSLVYTLLSLYILRIQPVNIFTYNNEYSFLLRFFLTILCLWFILSFIQLDRPFPRTFLCFKLIALISVMKKGIKIGRVTFYRILSFSLLFFRFLHKEF